MKNYAFFVENLTHYNLTCYHVSRRNDKEIVKKIFNSGLEAGFGANCGVGVYAYIDKPNKSDREGIVFECVADLHNFLILEPDIARKIYHDSSVDYQLKHIFGEQYINFQNKDAIFQELKSSKYLFTSQLNNILNNLKRGERNDKFWGDKLKGYIFQKEFETKPWLICYDTTQIRPVRYSIDYINYYNYNPTDFS